MTAAMKIHNRGLDSEQANYSIDRQRFIPLTLSGKGARINVRQAKIAFIAGPNPCPVV